MLLLSALTEKTETLELRVIPPKNKTSEYRYQVIDEEGNVAVERRSFRTYVAALCYKNKETGKLSAPHYFGRLDLVGKGDSGYGLKKGYRFYALAVINDLKSHVK